MAASPTFASAIYAGTVMHQRMRPRRHRLTYRVFNVLFDLDELPTLDRHVAGFGHNRFSLLSFYDRDHGPSTDAPLRPWVEQQLAAAGIDLAGGPIRLLCYPRMLGYVFNPLSVYFCYRRTPEGETLAAILHEVSNTFGERHSYLIPAQLSPDGLVHQACAKELYVSPFIDMEMTYNFRIRPPGEDLAVNILEKDKDGPLLTAAFSARREPLTAASLALACVRFPLLTLKVIGGIHWEALKLWLKGIPLVHRPRAPLAAVSIIATAEAEAAAGAQPGL